MLLSVMMKNPDEIWMNKIAFIRFPVILADTFRLGGLENGKMVKSGEKEARTVNGSACVSASRVAQLSQNRT